MSSLPKFILNMPSGQLSLLSMDYQATGRKKRIFAKYLSFQEALVNSKGSLFSQFEEITRIFRGLHDLPVVFP